MAFTRSAARFAAICVGLAFFAAPAVATSADHGREAEANAAFNAYPKDALDRGEQGTVYYHVQIDGRGRPTECRITESSGYQRLDLATCTMLMDRAQFTPSQSRSGRRIRSTYDGKVIWRIS